MMLQRLITFLQRVDAYFDAPAVKDRQAARDRRRQLREAAGPWQQRLRAARAAFDGQPLIWTKDGNVPMADLQYLIEWQFNSEEIVFREQYRLQDGETIVKDSRAVYKRTGQQIGAVAQPLV